VKVDLFARAICFITHDEGARRVEVRHVQDRLPPSDQDFEGASFAESRFTVVEGLDMRVRPPSIARLGVAVECCRWDG
jgi:hypothetical protein